MNKHICKAYRFHFFIWIAYWGNTAQINVALDSIMFSPLGPKQQHHSSMSRSLSDTSCKSTGTFCKPLGGNPVVAGLHLNIWRGRHCWFAYALLRVAIIVRVDIDMIDIGHTLFIWENSTAATSCPPHAIPLLNSGNQKSGPRDGCCLLLWWWWSHP